VGTSKFFAVAAGMAAAIVPAMALVTAAPAGATTVTTEAELRTAYADAAETSIVLADDITLADCTVGGGDLDRDSGVALTLDGAGFTVTQTCADERVLESHTDLSLQNVTITGGNLGKGDGGGISETGALTLTGVRVTGNSAVNGGGLDTGGGDFTVTDSVIDGNQADPVSGEAGGMSIGGGITTITDSTIAGNSADFAGAFFRYGGGPDTQTVTLVRTTVSGNTATSGAPGLDSLKPLILINSTVTDNTTSATEGSGGVSATDDITLVYSTIAGNSGGEWDNVVSTTRIISFGSVVADPIGSGVNCGFRSGPASQGYNFSDDTTCGFTDPTDMQGPGNNPLLGALAANGGPTSTLLPQAGSPLLDKIPAASCQAGLAAGVTTDQRGVTRPQGTGCDIGAVEVVVEAPVPSPAVVNPRFTG
jgi:hypothetical protein